MKLHSAIVVMSLFLGSAAGSLPAARTSGHDAQVVLLHPAGGEFDQSAVETVMRWTFEPATLNHRRVSMEMPIEFSFDR